MGHDILRKDVYGRLSSTIESRKFEHREDAAMERPLRAFIYSLWPRGSTLCHAETKFAARKGPKATK